MSTNQAPNPRDLKTWEDAFQYPVPVVRRLEQQLRSNINENRDKLRSLVGSSYRDLLGTAERIVEMDTQMHSVESRLGDIGHKCSARALERIAANQQRNAKAQRHRSFGRNALASNIALLQRCMSQASHLTKRGDSALRAAKLLVLARLLYTSAAKSPDPPALLDSLKSKLTSLRRKLLSHIDKHLSSSGLERPVLVDTLAAFSLATTSTPTDVLNHFLHVRATALGDLVEIPKQQGLHDALNLLIATIKDVQTVFPKQLSSLLGNLQDEPLLQDQAIRDMPELNLDIYEQWIADDVRNFTPWLRHDQLQASAASSVLKKWVAQARSTLIQGLNSLLDTMQDASAIVVLRKDFLSRSLSPDRKLPGLDPSNLFEALRSCFVRRLQEVAVQTTGHVTTIVVNFLEDDSMNNTSTSSHAANLWDPANMDIDPGKGAINFRNFIHNASQGKGDRLQGLEKSLTKWSSTLAVLSGTIKAMREDRWNDDLDLDIEDDFEIDSPQDLLAREDPEELQKLLVSEQVKSLSSAYEKVQAAASSIENGERAIYLLRLLREVGHHAASSEGQASMSKPAASLFQALHETLAERVLAESSESHNKSLKLFVRSPIMALWEGTPPLPVQPSPACFRYLHETCRTMKGIGSDVWSPSAVSILKGRLRKTILSSLDNLSSNTGQTNGSAKAMVSTNERESSEASAETDAATNGTETKKATVTDVSVDPRIIQALFDLLYLDKILAVPETSAAGNTFDNAVKDLMKKSEMEDVALERLRKSSVDYYKRTYLLFGLLAVG